VADPVDEAAGRLYGLPLEEFTRERDALARELRKEKQRDVAAAVGKLPKPSQAAWSANQLAREHRDLVDELLAAGDALRDAQDAAIGGKGAAALRDAAAVERQAVDALMTVAKDLRPGGRKPSEATLERLRNTLHAAAGDETVRDALDAGRLVEDATATGAWGLLAPVTGDDAEPEARPRRQRERKAPAKKKRAPARSAEQAAADREAAEREAAERAAALQEERERRQRLEAELREARADRRARDREMARAEREADRAAKRLEAALAAAEEAREQAEEAQEELEAARKASEAARDEVARLEEQLD
jgi:hypothetical protein